MEVDDLLWQGLKGATRRRKSRARQNIPVIP